MTFETENPRQRGSLKRNQQALLSVTLGTLMISVNTTIVNVAWPTIGADLSFSRGSMVWIVNSYLVPYASFLFPAGRLGDLFSRRFLFLWGAVTFVVTSLGCGFAQETSWFVAARALQGISAAFVNTLALSLAASLFSEPTRRTSALSLLNFMSIAGGSLALFLGGVLMDLLGWRWLFFLNVPVGIAIFALGLLSLPEEPQGRNAAQLNVKCVVRMLMSLASLRLLRARQFAVACIIQFLFTGALSGWRFITSLYLELMLGYTPLRVGLSFLPATVIAAALTMGLSVRVIGRFGVRPSLAAGLIVSAAGLFLFALMPVGGHFLTAVLPGMVFIGIGIGVAATPLLLAAMSQMPDIHSGTASGIFSTIAYVGAALGVAVLGGVVTGHSSVFSGSELDLANSNKDGFRMAYGMDSLFVVAATIALGRLTARNPRRANLIEY